MHELDSIRNVNSHGVRVRSDYAGDPWANEHRDELSNWFHMQDVDGFLGAFAFAKNTGDRLFMEHVPDSYQNRGSVVRRFGIVGLFDRKKSVDCAMSSQNVLTTAFYLHLCRSLGQTQSKPPKFFFIAGESAPWSMIELSIETGKVTGRHQLQARNWRMVWEAFGLVTLRQELERHILGKP